MKAIQDHVSYDTDLETLCTSLLNRFGRDAEDDIALVAIRARQAVSRNSVPVRPATDLAACATDQRQHRADHQQDDPDGPENRDFG
jgi:hypothetical protein